MQEKKIIAGLYPRVSTEDQSRYGHSLDEQEYKSQYQNYQKRENNFYQFRHHKLTTGTVNIFHL